LKYSSPSRALQGKIVLYNIWIGLISLRSGDFYSYHTPGAYGKTPEYAGLLLFTLSGERKIIIYLNAWAIGTQ
jgi:hypothetical protein